MAWFLQGARVQGESPITVIKLWLYAAVSVAVGAWITPLLYNAGKALAEVSARKTTNDALEWLAKCCEIAELPSFFGGAVLLVAAVLFFPWMEWIYTRSKTRGPSVGRWFLELPESETPAPEPDASRRFGGLRGGCRGFALVAGLVLVMSLVLVPSRDFVFRMPAEGLWRLCLRSFSGALLLALVMELFFRGIALGIFIRAMKPAAAVGMSAVFFACLLALNPPPGLNVADPDASGTGFELLGRILTNDAAGRNFVGTLIPLLALGGVLGYARWRSAALWLPIGLHAGWIFGVHLSGRLIVSTSGGRSFPIGTLVQESIIPLIAILLAGMFVYRQFQPADAPLPPKLPEPPWMRRVTHRVLDLLYPSYCALCRSSLKEGASLCVPCRDDLPRIAAPFCEACGEAFFGKIEGPFECPNCTGLSFAFEFARPAMLRDERTLDLVHRLKYGREIHLARELGALAGHAFEDPRLAPALEGKWPIIPVPLHRSRLRERHFNQAEEIARPLSALTGCPIVLALRRVRSTDTQTLLSRRQRMDNLKGAFAITRLGQKLASRHCQGAILIDDVLTTGSTVNECARTLRKAGIKRILVVTVMRG